MRRELVTDSLGLAHLRSALQMTEGPIAIDLETTGLDPVRDKISGVGFSWEDDYGVYVPGLVGLDALRYLEGKKVCAHNGWYFDLPFIEKHLALPDWEFFDTMALARIIGCFPRIGLKPVVERCFKYKMIELPDLFNQLGLGKPLDFSRLPLDDERVLQYVTDDVIYLRKLFCMMMERPKGWKDERVRRIYRLEEELVPHARAIQAQGLTVDRGYITAETARLRVIADHLKGQLCELLGVPPEFNWGSHDQVAALFYGVHDNPRPKKPTAPWIIARAASKNSLELPIIEKTDGGSPSVNEATVSRLLADGKVPAEYRNALRNYVAVAEIEGVLTKLETEISTRIDEDGRIRPTFRQFKPESGRFSCDDPNLQNLAREKSWTVYGEDGPIEIRTSVRRALVAAKDHYLLEADFSQIESRIIASASADAAMMGAFDGGTDLHRLTAARMFDVEYGEVTKDQRSQGKTAQFGYWYGQGAYKMSIKLDIPLKTAKDLIKKFEGAFKTAIQFSKQFVADCKRAGGWAYTLLGRPRHLPDLLLKGDDRETWRKRSHAERQAFNHFVQGTAAEVFKRKMAKLSQFLFDTYGPQARIIAHTHDSYVIEVHKDIPENRLMAEVREILETQIPSWVPLTVEFKSIADLSGTPYKRSE